MCAIASRGGQMSDKPKHDPSLMTVRYADFRSRRDRFDTLRAVTKQSVVTERNGLSGPGWLRAQLNVEWRRRWHRVHARKNLDALTTQLGQVSYRLRGALLCSARRATRVGLQRRVSHCQHSDPPWRE